jgi:hypothetical protein
MIIKMKFSMSHNSAADDFVTPCSTPPNEKDGSGETIGAQADATKKESTHALPITDPAVMDKLYEK